MFGHLRFTIYDLRGGLAKQKIARISPGAHLDTTIGTPDEFGNNTRRLHTCRMNPAFHADATSCIGGSVRPFHGSRPPPARSAELRFGAFRRT